MKREMICIVCPKGCRLTVEAVGETVQVSGNTCPRGKEYGTRELTDPRRVVTSTVELLGGPFRRLPVKTDGAIPKKLIFACMEEINKVSVSVPVRAGDVLIENVLGTGVNVVAARTAK